jgi:transposase
MARDETIETEVDVADVAAVVDELRALWDADRKDQALEVVESLLSAMFDERKQHVAKIRELLRKVYGRSSERLSPNQLKLALEGLRDDAREEVPADPEAELPADPPERKQRKKRKSGRRPLPKDLPREEIRLTPSDEQIEGLGPMEKIGEERSEVLEYIPAQFKILIYVRETWASKDGAVVTAEVPNKVIEKGLPGPGLLTQVVLSKYKDHAPLNRQTKIYARSGVDLSRNTLVDWVAAVAFLLEPLARRINELALLAHALQVDDTRMPTLDRRKAKKIKRGHLWVLVGDQKWIAFRYTPDWTSDSARSVLGDRIGWAQVDGYAGFEVIAKAGLALLVGCWMHARRYFVKAFEAKDMRAAVPLEMIKRIYKIERASKEAGDDHDARYRRRQAETVPILDELEIWIAEHIGSETPTSRLGRALTYAHNHWEILRVVVNDGALEIDNGEVERIIRGPAVGRKNWLFAGSEAGGERAAIIMTVLETAARAGVDLREYLHDLLVKISGGWPMARLDELLPDNWAAARETER